MFWIGHTTNEKLARSETTPLTCVAPSIKPPIYARHETQTAGAHIVVSGNLAYNNAQLVPTDGAGKITDGEGIILDTNPSYTGEILVQNNTVYGNGSSGIESYLTNGAVITGNTVYGNNTKTFRRRASPKFS